MTNFYIGPVIKDGLRKDVKPHAIPEDAFVDLTNAFQWQGRIRKRLGYTSLGRLANGTPVMGLKNRYLFSNTSQELIAFDTTASYRWNGSSFISLPSVMPVTWSGSDSQFFWTENYAGGFWATNGKEGLHAWAITNFANSAGTGNSATVDVTSAGNSVAVGDYVYFLNVDSSLENNAGVLAVVTAAGNPFTVRATNLPSTSTFAWLDGATATGMVVDSTQTIAGQDGIRYYGSQVNASSSYGDSWINYNPPVDLNNALVGALMIFVYRGYLVFLNTTEGNEQATYNYGNRARWTQIGTPYYSYPAPGTPNPQGVDVTAVRDDRFGRGGANDAPTTEVIVTAGFVNDILIVKFEKSTWRLRFANNAQNPFVWERINIELGSSCTYSPVIFDQGLMSISNRGLDISDVNNVQRIDQKIPLEIFNIRQDNEGFNRVQGIRTFYTRLVYWTFPSNDNPFSIYPDKVLVYNYETETWSFYDDSFTCFGYFFQTSNGYTWGELTNAWSSYTNISWNSGIAQSGYENIIAGNQQGYVFILEQTNGENAPSLSISAIGPNIFTSADNNLANGTWIRLSGITGTITSDDGVSLNGRSYKLANANYGADDFTLSEFKPIAAGNASGTSFSYTIGYQYIIPGSAQINVGSTIVFYDTYADGILVESSGLGTGTINYETGLVSLTFNPAIAASAVNIRVVTLDPTQGSDDLIATTGVYAGGGEIAKISNIDIKTKYFNFFKNDQRARLSKIDFYLDSTSNGQFTCNVFAESGNVPVNEPLSDNPFSNIVLTTINPYQVGEGEQTIFRLFCDAIAQTIQLQFTYSDAQMAVPSIVNSNIELDSMIISMRPGGRLV